MSVVAASTAETITNGAAALLAAITGFGGWWLSRRGQRHAEDRDQVADAHSFLEQQRAWQTDIVGWYQARTEELKTDYLRQLAVDKDECRRQLGELQAQVTFWQRRANGKGTE